jgi:polar amino acid transport system substrate-binding protein
LSRVRRHARSRDLFERTRRTLLNDSPVVDYQVTKSGGQFKLVGKTYATAPYGIAIPKDVGLTKAGLAGVKALMASGRYTAIVKKCGIQTGAISTPRINAAIS